LKRVIIYSLIKFLASPSLVQALHLAGNIRRWADAHFFFGKSFLLSALADEGPGEGIAAV
jgi:hypothetical protein